MNSDSILTIIVLVVLMIIILRSKPFKVWWMGRNKTDDQKKAIKFLIYGPSRSKISKDEYDALKTVRKSSSLTWGLMNFGVPERMA